MFTCTVWAAYYLTLSPLQTAAGWTLSEVLLFGCTECCQPAISRLSAEAQHTTNWPQIDTHIGPLSVCKCEPHGQWATWLAYYWLAEPSAKTLVWHPSSMTPMFDVINRSVRALHWPARVVSVAMPLHRGGFVGHQLSMCRVQHRQVSSGCRNCLPAAAGGWLAPSEPPRAQLRHARAAARPAPCRSLQSRERVSRSLAVYDPLGIVIGAHGGLIPGSPYRLRAAAAPGASPVPCSRP